MKCKIFRATFVSHWKVSLSNVLSSSSIRTCRILNIKYLLLFSTGRRSGENQNKHSKFKFDAHQYHKKWENTYSIFFQVITQGNCDLSLILDPTTNSEILNPNCHDISNQKKVLQVSVCLFSCYCLFCAVIPNLFIIVLCSMPKNTICWKICENPGFIVWELVVGFSY